MKLLPLITVIHTLHPTPYFLTIIAPPTKHEQ